MTSIALTGPRCLRVLTQGVVSGEVCTPGSLEGKEEDPKDGEDLADVVEVDTKALFLPECEG